MAVPVQAYMAIEESLVQRLSSSYNQLTADILRQILPLVEAQRWGEAEAFIFSLDVGSIFDDNEPYIEYVTYAAMIFGASRLTKQADNTIITGRDHTEVMQLGTSLLRRSLVKAVTERIQESLMDDLYKVKAERFTNVQKAERVVLPFQSFAPQGENILKMVSQLHTSRLSAFGYTAEAEVLGITKYSISEQLDARVCPVCAYMHGKSFSVSDARTTLDRVLRTQDPDDLKLIQPWPKQDKEGLANFKSLSKADLVASNWHIPPYHGGCRGILVASSDVPPLLLTPKYPLPLGDEDWKKWSGLLRETEKTALNKYAGSWYATINHYLRFGVKGIAASSLKEAKETIGTLQSLFKKVPTLSVTTMVYRGMRVNPAVQAVLNGLKIGSVLTDKAYMSTTRSLNKAAFFGIDETGIIIDIELPKGLPIIDIGASGLEDINPEEAEVLLRSNSKFFVTSITRNDKGDVERLKMRAVL